MGHSFTKFAVFWGTGCEEKRELYGDVRAPRKGAVIGQVLWETDSESTVPTLMAHLKEFPLSSCIYLNAQPSGTVRRIPRTYRDNVN